MDFITILQLIAAILLSVVILLQHKGAGAGSMFGGSGAVYTEKRGLEKKLHNASIVMSIVFLALSIYNFMR